MSDYVMGFDIGGTKCAVLLARVDKGIQLLDRVCFPTEAERGFEQARDKLFRGGHAILERNGIAAGSLLAIGISCGGPLNSRTGMILSPPHLPGWDEIPLTRLMEEEFGVKAYLQNDANACALVEWEMGAGRGSQNMVFLTMGTGMGAGIIAEGRLVEGASGQAGEVGHVRLEPDGPVGFGKPGSVEVYCSGAGVASTAREYTEECRSQGREPVWLREGLGPEDLNAKVIADYADSGDPDARVVYERVGGNLGRVLSVLIDLLNPELIVIGSIFVRSEALIRPAMERMIRQEALPGSLADCRIVPAETGEKLGDYASILAACYALGIDAIPPGSAVKGGVERICRRLLRRYPAMEAVSAGLLEAFALLQGTYRRGGKLLVCGNGGSAADAEHIVGELMKSFALPRRTNDPRLAGLEGLDRLQGALPAIALTQHAALSTAFLNDVDPSLVFAQQVYGYGRRGDALLCISTSGNAENVIQAARTARALGVKVIGMTGQGGGGLAQHCDVLLAVPAAKTADVQELHLPLYHTLCAMLEEDFFGEPDAQEGSV